MGGRLGRMALVGVAALLGLGASGCAVAGRTTSDRACSKCYRFQQTRTTKCLGLPIWRSNDAPAETEWSAVYDRVLENTETPHEHQWLPAKETSVSYSLFGQRHEQRTDTVFHYRTRYALDVVAACEEMDDSPGPAIYAAIVGDYNSRVTGKAERLAKLSKAAEEAKRSSAPGQFWVEWWKANRASYEPVRRRRGRYETKIVTGEMKVVE